MDLHEGKIKALDDKASEDIVADWRVFSFIFQIHADTESPLEAKHEENPLRIQFFAWLFK